MKQYLQSLILLVAAVATLPLVNTARAVVGAVTPFTSVEAESGALAGGAVVRAMTAPPTDRFTTPEIESSGRAFVELKGTEQSVTLTNTSSGNYTALNLRFSIPDALNGGGTSATLNLYVDGVFRQSIALSSVQVWLYENAADYNSDNQNPTNGHAHVFFDETHFFITGAPVAPGSRITLQQDVANTAAFYWLDVVDLENPPGPLSQPANSLAITAYGAVANNTNFDSTSAIQSCINAAQSQGKSVWIPPGVFYLKTTAGLNASGITIEGAGMWHSTIYRNVPLPNATPLAPILAMMSCTCRNLALDANAPSRSREDGDGGGVDANGVNWLMEDMWVQHASSGFWASGVNGIVRDCRMGNTWGDGINLNNVALGGPFGINLSAYNNFVRGAGDDGVTINSVNTNETGTVTYTKMSNTTLSNNTCISIWWAHGVGVYGGINNLVQDNLVCDPAKFTGVFITEFGPNGSTLDSAIVRGNVVIRGGGNAHDQQQPALSVGGSFGRPLIANAVVISNTIIDAIYAGAAIESGTNLVFQGNTIISPNLNGITIASGQVGSAIVYSNNVSGLGVGKSPFVNSSSLFVTINPVAAASFSSMSGVLTEPCAEGGRDVTAIESGDWTAYSNINLTGVDTFVARVAGASFGGNIEVRLDSPGGTLIGTCAVAGTGGFQTYANAYCKLTGASGTHSVYLVYTGPAGSLFNVEYFGFFTSQPVGSHQLAVGNTYALKFPGNGKYVTAPNGGSNSLVASSAASGIAEQFEVVAAGGGNIGLRALVNTQYVCAENGGSAPLIANRPAVGAWETFTELVAGNGNLALRAQNNGKYVTAPNGGANPLIAQSSAIGAGESFVAEFIAGVPPPAPFGLTAVSGQADATLNWGESLGATSYNVKRSGTVGGTYTNVATNVTSLGFTQTGLVAGASFYYAVSAVNPAGESSNSAPVSVMPGVLKRTGWIATASSSEANGSPGRAIDGNSNTRWSTGANQANGQWFQVDMGQAATFYRLVLDANGSASDYPRGYQVNVSNDGSSWGSPVASGTSASAVTTINFSTQTARYIRVTQTGNSGPWWSIHEFDVLGTAGTSPPAPASPAAVAGSGQAILTWSMGAGVTGYNLRRGGSSGGPFTVVATNLAALGFTDTGLNNGVIYYYVLAALNPVGQSANSPVVIVRPVSQAAVLLQAATANGEILVGWPNDHTGWSLQVQTNAAGAGLGTNWTSVPGSQMTNQMTFPIEVASGSTFFRLVYP